MNIINIRCVCSRPPKLGKLLTATLIKHKTQPVRTNKIKGGFYIGGKLKNKRRIFVSRLPTDCVFYLINWRKGGDSNPETG